jgi:FkbM family methyltransferase
MISRVRRYRGRLGWPKALEIYLKSKMHRLVSFRLPELRAPLLMRPHTTDRTTFEEIFIEGQYDLALAGDPRVIIDAGANVGYAAALFASRFPLARVIAIECEHENFALLERNLAGYDNVTCLERALWPRNTRVVIDNPKAATNAFCVREDPLAAGAIESIAPLTALAVAGGERIDLFKLDIEGGEKELFEAADCDAWLERTQVLMIELHERYKPGTARAFWRAIERHPFEQITTVGETMVFSRTAPPAQIST